MTELKRWIDSHPPAGLAQLIDAARTDEPDAAALSSTLLALGVAEVATSGAAGASAGSTAPALGVGGAASGAPLAAVGGASTAQAASVAGALMLAKWGLSGLACGAVAVLAVSTVSKVVTPPSAPLHAPAVAASGVRLEQAELPAPPPRRPDPQVAHDSRGAAAALTSTPPGRSPPASTAVARSAGGDLAQEVAVLDRARAALAAGELASALTATREYERRFAAPQFEPEIRYIRAQALERAGDAAATF